MKEILFTVDFATKKKGDKWKCDSQLANQLVRVDQVAVYATMVVEENKTDEATEEVVVKKKSGKK